MSGKDPWMRNGARGKCRILHADQGDNISYVSFWSTSIYKVRNAILWLKLTIGWETGKFDMKIGIYKDTFANNRGADIAVRNLAAGLGGRGHAPHWQWPLRSFRNDKFVMQLIRQVWYDGRPTLGTIRICFGMRQICPYVGKDVIKFCGQGGRGFILYDS